MHTFAADLESKIRKNILRKKSAGAHTIGQLSASHFHSISRFPGHSPHNYQTKAKLQHSNHIHNKKKKCRYSREFVGFFCGDKKSFLIDVRINFQHFEFN